MLHSSAMFDIRTTFGLLVFFPGVFLHSRAHHEATVFIIMRVNVRTTTQEHDISLITLIKNV